MTIEQIKQDLETAAYVDRLLPPIKVQGCRSFMPEIIYTQQEIAFMDRRPIRPRPTQEQINLWERVILWMRPLNVDERKLVWKRANRLPWKLLEREFGISRQALTHNYNTAIGKIFGYIKRGEKM